MTRRWPAAGAKGGGPPPRRGGGGGGARRVVDEGRTTLARARVELEPLPVAAFPAVAYGTLTDAYARGRTPGELMRRLRMLGAVLRGRI